MDDLLRQVIQLLELVTVWWAHRFCCRCLSLMATKDNNKPTTPELTLEGGWTLCGIEYPCYYDRGGYQFLQELKDWQYWSEEDGEYWEPCATYSVGLKRVSYRFPDGISQEKAIHVAEYMVGILSEMICDEPPLLVWNYERKISSNIFEGRSVLCWAE